MVADASSPKALAAYEPGLAVFPQHGPKHSDGWQVLDVKEHRASWVGDSFTIKWHGTDEAVFKMKGIPMAADCEHKHQTLRGADENTILTVNHRIDHESQVTVFAYPGERTTDGVVSAVTEAGHRFKGREVRLRCHVKDQNSDGSHVHILGHGSEDGNSVRFAMSDREFSGEKALLATAEKTSTWHEAAQYELNVAANVDLSLMVLLTIIWIERKADVTFPVTHW